MRIKKDRFLYLRYDAEMQDWLRVHADKRRCSIAQLVRDLILREMQPEQKAKTE